MKKIFFVISIILMTTQLEANNSTASEVSHVVGGAVMAGGITAVVDSYYPEYKDNRGMLGFEISSAAIVVEQTIEFAFNGDAGGQLLDVASHVVGSAFGAFVTDQYILAPVISNSSAEGKYVGLTLHHSF